MSDTRGLVVRFSDDALFYQSVGALETVGRCADCIADALLARGYVCRADPLEAMQPAVDEHGHITESAAVVTGILAHFARPECGVRVTHPAEGWA